MPISGFGEVGGLVIDVERPVDGEAFLEFELWRRWVGSVSKRFVRKGSFDRGRMDGGERVDLTFVRCLAGIVKQTVHGVGGVGARTAS